MKHDASATYSAFSGSKRIASGDLRRVVVKAKQGFDRDKWAQVLIFDDLTSDQIDVDYSGTAEDVVGRIVDCTALPVEEQRNAGRPKLGVVAREVTLLPRHWDWLSSQPGGASAAIRKLVEQARTANQGRDRRRRAQESAYRFLSAMAGNEPGFEEATRALFGGDEDRFNQIVKPWPVDVRDHARTLAAAVFGSENSMTM